MTCKLSSTNTSTSRPIGLVYHVAQTGHAYFKRLYAENTNLLLQMDLTPKSQNNIQNISQRPPVSTLHVRRIGKKVKWLRKVRGQP